MRRTGFAGAAALALAVLAFADSASAEQPFSLGPDVVYAKGTRTQTGATGTNCLPVANGSSTADYTFYAPGDGTLTIIHYATGNRSKGTIAPSGQFDAPADGGETSYSGQISLATATAQAVGTVHNGTCTYTYSYVFTLDIQLKLKTVRFDFADRVAAEKRALSPQVRELALQKDALDANLPDYTRAAEKALALVAPAQRKERAAAEELRKARLDVEALVHEEHFVPASAKPLVARRDRLDQQIAQLEDELLQRRAANPGGDFGGLIDQIERGRASLKRLTDEIARATGPRSGFGEAEARLNARVAGLTRKLQDEVRATAHAEEAVQRADLTLRNALGRRAAVDEQLLAVGDRLRGLDFEIARVTASAGGKVVFVADNSHMQRIADLEAAVARAKAVEQRDRAERERAREDYFNAEHRAVGALEGLIAQYWQGAWIGVGIDTLDAAYDLGVGFLEGGPVGFLYAAAKKESELLTALLIDKLVDPSGVDYKSIDDDLNRQFGALLSNSFSFHSLARAGAEDAVSLSVRHWAQDDYLTPKIAKILDREFAAAYRKSAVRLLQLPARPEDYVKTLEREAEQLARMRVGIDSIKARLTIKDVGKTLLKDIAKSGLKMYFVEGPEREAWLNAILKDLEGRFSYPLMVMTRDAHWRSLATLTGLQAELADELLQFDPKTQFPAQQADPFPPGAQVVVSLQVYNPQEKSPPLELTVGGVAAQPTGTPYSWSVPAYALAPGNDRTIVLR